MSKEIRFSRSKEPWDQSDREKHVLDKCFIWHRLQVYC